MIKGLYFYQCNESSTAEQQVFRYRYLENKNDDAISFKHPYFLMISRDAITFYKDANRYGSPSHVIKNFRLPLYSNGTALDKLTEAIKGLCSENPIELSKDNVKQNEQISEKNPFVFHNITDKKELPYWVVFQHFLYDLSFSDLFQNAIHFEEAITKLTDDYFVKCILAKGEYLYWLSKYDDENRGQQFILERLWEADQTWVNLIIDESHNRVLEVSNNWFNGAEVEMQKVLGIHFEIDKKQKGNIVEKYKKYSDRFCNYKRVDYLGDFSSKIEKKDYEKELEYKQNKVNEIKIQRDAIYHFFLMRFSTWSLEKYIFKYNLITTLFSLALPIILSFYLIGLLVPKYKLGIFTLLVTCIIIVTFFNFLFKLIGNKLSSALNLKEYLFYQRITFIFITILLSFISYFLLYFNKNIIEYFTNFINIDKLLCVLIIFTTLGLFQVFIRPFCFLISGIIFTAFGTIKNVSSYFNYSIGYPLMSIAIVTIWLGYIPINEEAWFINRNFDNGYFLFYFSAFTLVILISIYYFVNDVMYGGGFFKGIRRSLALYLKGMSISILVGIVTMKVSKEHYFNNPSDFFPEDTSVQLIAKIDTAKMLITDRNFSYTYGDYAINDYIRYSNISFAYTNNVFKSYRYEDNTENLENESEYLKNLIIQNHMLISNYNHRIPSIIYVELSGVKRYIFPKLLLMYSSFAFFIGLFAQVAFKGSNYKENL